MALKKFEDHWNDLAIFKMGVASTNGLAYVPDASGSLTVAGATDYYRVHLPVAAANGEEVRGILTGAVIATCSEAISVGQPCKPAASGKYAVATVGTDHVSGYAATATSLDGDLFTLIKVA